MIKLLEGATGAKLCACSVPLFIVVVPVEPMVTVCDGAKLLPIVMFVADEVESTLVVFMPDVNVSKAVAVSAIVFCKYNAFAFACVKPDPLLVVKKALLYAIPL